MTILARRIRANFLAITIISSLTSCATQADLREVSNPMPRNEKRIIVQVCLPDRAVSFEDVEIDMTDIPKPKTMREMREANGLLEAGSVRITVAKTESQDAPDRVTVRRWTYILDEGALKRAFLGFGEVLNQGGVPSSIGGHIFLWANSEKNQPIYELEGHRAEDTIALNVSAEVNGEFVTYWYKPPRTIPEEKFSDWQEPISQETRDDKGRSRNGAFWDLTHGRELEIRPTIGTSPKVRYQLMTVEEYYDQYRFWYRAQKAVSEKFYRGVVGEERDKRHFVPKIMGTIPACY